MKAAWYFDFISPFSYLHLKQFGKLPADLEIEYVPVLFAGILKHYEHMLPGQMSLDAAVTPAVPPVAAKKPTPSSSGSPTT